MSETIIGAIIGGAFGVIVAIISSNANFRALKASFEDKQNKAIESISTKVAIVEVKLDTLWEIYAKDAIRDAKERGIIKENSPLTITQKGRSIFSEDLLERMEKHAKGLISQGDKDINYLCACMINAFFDEILFVSIESNIPVQAVIGSVKVLCQGIARESGHAI